MPQSYRVEKLWSGTESGRHRVDWEGDGRRGDSSWWGGTRPDRLLHSRLSGRSDGLRQDEQSLGFVQFQESNHIIHHNFIAV